VAGYFPSVDHEVLKRLLLRVVPDERLRQLLEVVVDASGAVGLPIGNLTSQHFANLYLDRLDHHVKEALRVKGYVRYMDDFLCFADSKDELHGVHAEIGAFVAQRRRPWRSRAANGTPQNACAAPAPPRDRPCLRRRRGRRGR
jgi:RNA-directed DNA polymerase